MSDTEWSRVRALFDAASALPGDADRRAFIADQAAGDDRLRDEVLSLVEALDRAGPFLDGARVGPAASFDDTADLETLRERIGPWRVVRMLGRGGMGTVYLGERDAGDVTLKAAIKIVAGSADSGDVLRRFRTARRILATLDHPGIARLLEGVPLTDHVAARHLDLRERLALFLDVCAAVAGNVVSFTWPDLGLGTGPQYQLFATGPGGGASAPLLPAGCCRLDVSRFRW